MSVVHINRSVLRWEVDGREKAQNRGEIRGTDTDTEWATEQVECTRARCIDGRATVMNWQITLTLHYNIT